MSKVDRYVKIIRRSDNNGGHSYRTVLFSESPHDNYESGSRPTAELFAHKLATCLECRVVQ
jgi:hypothetical protein